MEGPRGEKEESKGYPWKMNLVPGVNCTVLPVGVVEGLLLDDRIRNYTKTASPPNSMNKLCRSACILRACSSL